MPHLIVFSHLRWGFVYQRPQHLLSRLAARYRVTFIEEPVATDGEPRFERAAQGPNLEVLVPHTPVKAHGFHDDQLSVLTPLLVDHLRERGIDDCIAWFYTPMALPLLGALRPQAVVYDCMDELSAFREAPRQLRQRETALLKAAGVVFAGGPALYDAKRSLHPNVHCLPSAVDALHFSPDRLDCDAGAEHRGAIELQAAIATPRLGFFGVIDERLDTLLLAQLADARPDWQIVMVGPVVKIDPAQLPRRPNIHWLGMQSYERLPHLVAGWDVCLLPFAINESTRFISPTKTLEYMAAGKPVVSTAVRDVERLYGHVVRIATDAASFIAACDAALGESASDREQRLGAMHETVAQYSWDATAERMHALIEAERARAMAPPPLRELADVGQAGGVAANAAHGAGSATRAALPFVAGRKAAEPALAEGPCAADSDAWRAIAT